MPDPVRPSASSSVSTQKLVQATDYPHIPGYRFLRRLGQGGMASVYLAMQQSLDRPVSIKVMEREALEDEISKQRFEHEARTIAKLNHPCIVSIYEVGRTEDGHLYYIMPYLPNGDLAQRDLTHNETRVVEVLRALLSALDYAHARGIVHRDVKEENVLFDGADRPLLTDFGIALSKRDTTRITTAGLAVGSSGYMAPEQARGEDVDGRADLYSVGVLAFELLAGHLPYQSPEPLALALMHAQKPVPKLPPEKRHWQGLIDKAMAKSPAHRYRNAQQMLQALEQVYERTGSNPIVRRLRAMDFSAGRRAWKQPWLWMALGAVLIVFGLFVFNGTRPAGGAGQFFGSTPATASATSSADNAAPISSMPNTPAAGAIAGAGALAQATDAPELTPEATAALAATRDALAHNNLTAPPGNNAVELAQATWTSIPAAADGSKPEADKLVADVIAALSTQLARAITQAHDDRVLAYRDKALALATATVGVDSHAYKALQTSMGKALAQRVRTAVNAADDAGLVSAHAIADKLALSDVYAREAAKPRDAMTAATGPVKLPSGFRLLGAASAGRPAVAMERTEVTRNEYAAFVAATGHRSAECKQRTGSGFFAKKKSWSDPGFAQGGDHPVTCVSWDDANAYAQWRSARSGTKYRLPNHSDWLAATANGAGGNPRQADGTVSAGSGSSNSLGLVGLGSNASEWLQDCAGGCDRRNVAGGSWRVRSGVASSAAQPGKQGYDDIGFRLVTDLGEKR